MIAAVVGMIECEITYSQTKLIKCDNNLHAIDAILPLSVTIDNCSKNPCIFKDNETITGSYKFALGEYCTVLKCKFNAIKLIFIKKLFFFFFIFFINFRIFGQTI